MHLVDSVARLLNELPDPVDVLRDVWHLDRIILQVVKFLQQRRDVFFQLSN